MSANKVKRIQTMKPSFVGPLIFLLTQLPCVQAKCSDNVIFSRHHDEALLGHVIETVEANYMTCVEKCAETNGCRSVNFCHGNNGKGTCDLKSSSKTLHPDSIVSNSSCEYDEITRRDDCTSQVCLDKHFDKHRFNSSLFYLVKDRMTWNEARIFCQSLQADLTSIASQQEKHFIDSTLLPAAPQGNDTHLRLIALWKLDGTDADRELTFHGEAQIKTVDVYKALYLDGKNTSFATTPYISLLRSGFSVGAWVKLLKPASSGLILSSPDQFSVLVNKNGTVSGILHFKSGEVAQVSYSSIPFNLWVHVMFSWSRSRSMLIIINGEQKAQYIVPSHVSSVDLYNTGLRNEYDIGLDRTQSSVFYGYIRELAIHKWGAVNNGYTADKQIGRWDKFKGVWIGLNDLSNNGVFVNSDGSAVTYENWDDREPNNAGQFENCVAILLSSGKYSSWSDLTCGYELPFICRKKE